jgi:tetratricopeptide (TPR) repeat protein
MMQTGRLKKSFVNCRRCFFAAVLACAAVSGFAQDTDPFWLTLEQGKRFFREGEYGEALRCFEAARKEKENKYARLERDFITVLSIREVRRLGDDLALVEAYIQKEFRVAAAGALNELYYRFPRAAMQNSAKKALESLGSLKHYPEAEYWIGEVYRCEGEYGIALAQYQKAYAQKELVEASGFGLDILYKMADISALRRDYTGMEGNLNEILKTDESWNEENTTRSAMVNGAADNGLDRFLVLYRNDRAELEKAHRLLGLYYYSSNRQNRAVEHLLFSFLIQNTVIIEALKKQRYDYRFTTLDALLRDIAGSGRDLRRTLEQYMAESEYYRVLYYLGNAFYGNGRSAAARGIWRFLADAGPMEWKGRAGRQLSRPVLDGITVPARDSAVPAGQAYP